MQKSKAQSLYQKVNPFVGTGGHGHTFPGPTMPFGACQLSPDTRLTGWDGCSGYHYDDSIIYGFSHTHLSGTGCSDYGDILLMPVTSEMELNNYQYASHFSHQKENAHAGYYQVLLDDPKIHVALTATLHGGIHQYQFPKHKEQYVVLDLKHRDELLDSKMEKIDDYTIRGHRFSKAWAQNQKVFFEIKFSKPIENIVYEQTTSSSQTIAHHLEKSWQCLIKFKSSAKDTTLMVKCAISGVDVDGAHKNLQAEMPHWDFQKYKSQCEAAWEKELTKIKIQESLSPDRLNSNTAKENQQTLNEQSTFYTALYHCMIHPSIYNDVDGRYRGRDDKIHNTNGEFDYYTVFSLWDTYRALHPLLTLLDTKRSNDFVCTFIKQYEQCGRLPIWELSSNETNCMIGYHVVSVIWDAYNKGIKNYDVEKAYEAMKSIATHYTHYQNSGLMMNLKKEFRNGSADADALESYCKYGYVRADDSHESVSKTLEYAYDDWCIAQMAKALKKEKDFQYYSQRSRNWKNVFDPTTGFMRARKNGCLYQPFSAYTVDNNYTEANAWQYSFYVPHDVSSYYSLFGKSYQLARQLDQLFAAKSETEGREQADITGLIGQYAHGNEPSHHIAYLYNDGGEPYTTVQKVNFIKENFYKNDPDGLIGNEDCGQMSAWYVWSALGMYPVCPGNNTYYVTEPSFEKISINNNIELFKTRKHNQKELYFYDLNNKDFITHSELLQNKRLLFTYRSDIGTNCGLPPSPNFRSQSVPFIKTESKIFTDSLQIELASPLREKIFYSLNDSNYFLYTTPFPIYENTTITFFASNDETEIGLAKMRKGSCKYFATPNKDTKIQVAKFTKIPKDRKIKLLNEYSTSYHAGGANGLMDGVYGKLNWRLGDWQGYQGQDVEIIMELEKPRQPKKLAANFLEDQNAWIFYPKEVSFFASNDSINWTLLQKVETNKSDHNLEVSTSTFSTSPHFIKPTFYKYFKLLVKNFGPMPQWHEGRGYPTYIFIDEFEVDTLQETD
ncbi:MAG: GH92 family glycosyl hydrolase [Chitinophagaceae bacterium]